MYALTNLRTSRRLRDVNGNVLVFTTYGAAYHYLLCAAIRLRPDTYNITSYVETRQREPQLLAR